jgi:hypothetical protein
MQQRSLQPVRVSVSLIFLIHGLIIATWASRKLARLVTGSRHWGSDLRAWHRSWANDGLCGSYSNKLERTVTSGLSTIHRNVSGLPGERVFQAQLRHWIKRLSARIILDSCQQPARGCMQHAPSRPPCNSHYQFPPKNGALENLPLILRRERLLNEMH